MDQETTPLINDRSATNDSIFYITETATYTITVTDENGCSVSGEIFIEFIDIEIPNFFTPDGDGNNDTWAPRNMGSMKISSLKSKTDMGVPYMNLEGMKTIGTANIN